MKQQKVFFKNKRGDKLAGLLALPKGIKKPPIVIMFHGFRANKIRYEYKNRTAELLCENGIASLRVDFSGHGESEGETVEFTRKRATQDVVAAIQYVKSKNLGPIGIFATSMGAVITVMNAPEVRAIALYGPTLVKENEAKYYREKHSLAIREKGYIETIGCKKLHRYGKEFYEEVLKSDPLKYAKKITCPVLVIFGSDDFYVKKRLTKKVFNAFNEPKDIKIIEGAGHAQMTTKQANKIAELALKWFKKYLK